MTTNDHEKFAIRVNPESLAQLRAIAQDEGRQLEALIDEALSDLIARHKKEQPRPHVMTTYQASHDTFGTLYEKLADKR